MAAALQPQAGHPVGADAEVLHAAGVRAQVGPDPVERALDPRVDVQRVQVVQQQQALDQRVGEQPVRIASPAAPSAARASMMWLSPSP